MTGYTRQSSADIVPTAVVRAAPINSELNTLRDAFAFSTTGNTGHKHDGSSDEGSYVPLIADLDGLNKVEIDTSNNRVSFFVQVSSSSVEQVRVEDGVIYPVSDNDVDLGSSTLEFKNLYLDGTAKIDTLTVDENATVAGTFDVVGLSTLPTVNIDGGNVDGTVIGNTTPSAITGTVVTANTGFTGDLTGNVTGNLTGNVTGDVTGNLTGDVTGDVNSSGTSTFQNVTINGSLDMNAGTSATVTGLATPVNTTDAATKGYVDQEVTAVIDAAPGALDTLNELAAALNDDANFATTVNNSIATKVSKSGDTMTGQLDMGTNKVVNVATPTAGSDATTKTYVDGVDATKLNLSGGTMTGNIVMGANKVTSTANPTTDDDLARKAYVDDILGSATAAATSAANAATSETNAATSEANAATSEANAAASFDSFDDRYLGAKSTAPVTDNDGDPLIEGAIYWNTTSKNLFVYNGSAWVAAVFDTAGAMFGVNNLSDVDDVAASRTNLGLGTAATTDATDYLSVTNNLSDLSNAATAIQNLGITATATELNYVDGVTSPIQTQLDNISVTNATLTKSFVSGETSTIALSQAISAGAPVVSVTKEVPQTGLTSNTWDVATDGANYDRHDTAYATTLTPSNATGDGTFTLGTGSFASTDVGKTIEGNGGEAILTAADGSYSLVTPFNDTSTIASGDWSMFATVFDATNGLELSSFVDGFDIAGASYDSVSFSVASEDSSPRGIAFNNDGTKMYMVGSANDSVYQYSLSTGFDLSTASYDSVSFSVASEDTSPQNIVFNNDGTKMYMLGFDNELVFQYSLSTGFDLSTASYDSVSFSVNAQDTQPYDIAFNNDGTKMYMAGSANDSVYQYSLSTGFDLSTASYDSVSFSVTSEDTSPQDIVFNNDGTKMYMLGFDNELVFQYSLSTGFDLSTASYDSVSFSVSTQDTTPLGIAFNTDGTKMYMLGSVNDSVYQYTTGEVAKPTAQYTPAVTTTGGQIDSTYWTDINSMTTTQVAGGGQVYYAVSTDGRTTWKVIDDTNGERPIVRNNAGTWEVNDSSTYTGTTWVAAAVNDKLYALQEALDTAGEFVVGFGDASGWSYDSVSFSVSSQDGYPRGIAFNTDGTKMFIVGVSNDSVYQYSLSTAFDLSTASYDSVSFSVSSQDGSPQDLAFNNDGTKMYMTGNGNDSVHQYSLSTAFDLSTASYDSVSFSVSSQDTNPTGITFNNDGTKMYMVGRGNDSAYQYSLSTAFDLSTASYDSVSFSVASEDTLPLGIAFNNDGTKMYMVGASNESVYQYSLSTGFDLSTASYDSVSFRVATEDTSPSGITFNADGTKMYMVGDTNDSVFQYTTEGPTSSQNRMDKTQLEAVTDANHYTLGDNLDLMIALYLGSTSASIPSSDGVSINYDANIKNEGAVLGTDYNFDFPANDVVRITSNATQNLKVRIV